MNDFIKSTLKHRLILSIGTKGSGKTYTMLNYLKFCFAHPKMYDQYILILPAYTIEQNDSYSFIDANQKNIFIFEQYDEMITEHFLKDQYKKKKSTLFVIDDSSSQGMFNLDDSLKHLITVLRHMETTLFLISHAASGIMSPFIRMNSDILLLSRITNYKLLETIYDEFLSLTHFQGHDGKKEFIRLFIELHKKPFQIIYIDMRENMIDFDAGNWTWSKS